MVCLPPQIDSIGDELAKARPSLSDLNIQGGD